MSRRKSSGIYKEKDMFFLPTRASGKKEGRERKKTKELAAKNVDDSSKKYGGLKD